MPYRPTGRPPAKREWRSQVLWRLRAAGHLGRVQRFLGFLLFSDGHVGGHLGISLAMLARCTKQFARY
jgi:hypothetical protein